MSEQKAQKRRRSLEEALETLRNERQRIEVELRKAAHRREAAQAAASRELERIGDLAMESLDAGSTASEICRSGDVSRRTLYKMLDDRGYTRHRDKG
jgi:predicted  nucleic acid-binding Zn-ribbon protein